MNSLNKNTPTCALTDIMKHPLNITPKLDQFLDLIDKAPDTDK